MKKFDFESLLQIKSLNGRSEKDKINIVASLISYSYKASNISGLEHALMLSQQVNILDLSLKNQVYHHYHASLGWYYKGLLIRKSTKTSWAFQTEELSNEIFHLRKAISLPGFKNLPNKSKFRIYTNLGNTFSTVGRFIEAHEYWNKILDIDDDFSMALGNKGRILHNYSWYLFNDSWRKILLAFSYNNLGKALQKKENIEATETVEHFEQILKKTEPYVAEKYRSTLPNLNTLKLKGTKKLNAYRKWASKNGLFINPLNDICTGSIACSDGLTLPPISIEHNTPPTSILLFNQIKQEFATARFTFYKATKNRRPHYSDIDVLLSEADDPTLLIYNPDTYSYNIELLKITFRVSYSILDKIAYLLNDYLKLNHYRNDVDFRNLWYIDKNKDKKLKPFFEKSNNWPLRGLYWLSKDFQEIEGDYNEVIEPDAKEIAMIRNFIEHRAFRVFDRLPPNDIDNSKKSQSYIITRKEFEQKTLKVLKLTRAAIMYLSLAINQEEKKKEHSKAKSGTINMDAIPHSNKK